MSLVIVVFPQLRLFSFTLSICLKSSSFSQDPVTTEGAQDATSHPHMTHRNSTAGMASPY